MSGIEFSKENASQYSMKKHGFVVYPKDDDHETGFYFPDTGMFQFPTEHPYPPKDSEGKSDPIPDDKLKFAQWYTKYDETNDQFTYTVEESTYKDGNYKRPRCALSGNQFYFPRRKVINPQGQEVWKTTSDVYSWWHSPSGDFALRRFYRASDYHLLYSTMTLRNQSSLYYVIPGQTEGEYENKLLFPIVYLNGKSLKLFDGQFVISGFYVKREKATVNGKEVYVSFYCVGLTNILNSQIKLVIYDSEWNEKITVYLNDPINYYFEYASWPIRFDLNANHFSVLATIEFIDDNGDLKFPIELISGSIAIENNEVSIDFSREIKALSVNENYSRVNIHEYEQYSFKQTTTTTSENRLGQIGIIPIALNYNEDNQLVFATCEVIINSYTSNENSFINTFFHETQIEIELEKSHQSNISNSISNKNSCIFTIGELIIEKDLIDYSYSSQGESSFISTLDEIVLYNKYHHIYTSYLYSGNSSYLSSSKQSQIDFYFIDVVNSTAIYYTKEFSIQESSNSTLTRELKGVSYSIDDGGEIEEGSSNADLNEIGHYTYSSSKSSLEYVVLCVNAVECFSIKNEGVGSSAQNNAATFTENTINGNTNSRITQDITHSDTMNFTCVIDSSSFSGSKSYSNNYSGIQTIPADSNPIIESTRTITSYDLINGSYSATFYNQPPSPPGNISISSGSHDSIDANISSSSSSLDSFENNFNLLYSDNSFLLSAPFTCNNEFEYRKVALQVCLDERAKINSSVVWLFTIKYGAVFDDAVYVHTTQCLNNEGRVQSIDFKPITNPPKDFSEFRSDTLTLHPIGLY